MPAPKNHKKIYQAITLTATLFLSLPSKAQQSFAVVVAQSFDTETINIYCTSNQDGTGACINAETNDPFDCTLIPGQVISCRDADKKKFSCINYGVNQSGQGYFQCTPKPKLSSNETPTGSSF
jgi:hypothetical protein